MRATATWRAPFRSRSRSGAGDQGPPAHGSPLRENLLANRPIETFLELRYGEAPAVALAIGEDQCRRRVDVQSAPELEIFLHWIMTRGFRGRTLTAQHELEPGEAAVR